MLDFTESSLPQSLNTADPFPGGTFSEPSLLRDLSQPTRQNPSQTLLLAQRLIQQPTEIDPLAAAGLEAISSFDNQAAFSRPDSLEYLSETESNNQLSQQTDSLLSGGLLDQTSLNNARGTFTVGDSGLVAVDFLFDGGDYTGELAIFTLSGMGDLSTADFAREAARRSISGTSDGQVVIVDSVEGAQFSGELGERDRNQGSAASTKTFTLAAGTRFAFMLAPNSTIAAVAADTALSDSENAPLFSIAAYNPGGTAQLAQAAEGIFAMEDLQVGKGDADFNDIVFQVKGASSTVASLLELAAPSKNWSDNPTAEAFLDVSKDVENPNPVEPDPSEPPIEPSPVEPAPTDPVEPPVSPPIIVDISGEVNKFTEDASEEAIVTTGADSVTFGSQTVYIGTEQVSANNQNPIVRSFDPANPGNNWTRQDLETTGTDGRGLGLVWTGTALYGVFSVDGTQGEVTEDFRRATGDVQQDWLRSYGSGEGKVAVIGQLDPATGALLKAAYLSAVKENGKSNSLSITGASVNSAGNLVISAKSFFSPRRPNGSALTKDPNNTQDSPFDYALEITPDLTEVISTAADGWS